MSRIGKKQITLGADVMVTLDAGRVMVKGPKGELQQQLHPWITISIADGIATVSVPDAENGKQRAMWGTYASLLENMVTGVTTGYAKKLEINGVGYNWKVAGQKLTVNAGYSHPVDVTLPDGVNASVEGNVLTIGGIDKQVVGQMAAEIRQIRTPEPYKGTGIKYDDEQIRRKAGKQAAGAE